MVRIRALMKRDLASVEFGQSVYVAANVMRRRKVGSVLVTYEGEIVGIVTESDIVRKVVSVHRLPEFTSVETIMSSPIISIAEETPIFEAASIMEEHHTRHLAVANGHGIVGMVSVRDMLRPVATDEL